MTSINLAEILADLDSIADDDRTPDWKPVAKWHAQRITHAIADARDAIARYDQALNRGLAAGSEPF